MLASEYIKQAQAAGWRIKSSRGGILRLTCGKQGCKGTLSVQMNNLGPVPAPCGLEHHGQFGAGAIEPYRAFVQQLVKRRRQLGLSQEDINAAAGLADGHLNKLESFARIAQFPTLQLWAQTLGYGITLTPAKIPAATARAIERRPAPLRETERRAKTTKAYTEQTHHGS